ncbi:MAG: hypothetical protein WKG06_21395 [Segetibacter sp.]
MEALKTKGIAHEGILSVRVPKEFEDKELEVIILSSDIYKNENKPEEIHLEKVKRLLSIVGKAKYPDFPITKYDVYDQ